MKVSSAALVAAVVAVSAPLAFAQQATQKTIPADLAAIMVQEAVAKCRADGIKVSAKVVDASNVEKAFLRDDGAGAVTVEFVQAKLNTVILTGRASGTNPGGAPPMIKGANPKVPVFGAVIGLDSGAGKMVAGVEAGGAIPITIGGELAGAIGVSGAPSADKDIACATAGLAKVADRLK
jgi:uncharacterized protein GlcG (DUF336 family)